MPANYSRTSSRLPTPAAPHPTGNTSSNRRNSPPSRPRTIKDFSSSRNKNIRKPPQEATTRGKNSRWSSATRSKRSILNKGMPLSRGRWSSARRRGNLHQDRRAVLLRESRIDCRLTAPEDSCLVGQHDNEIGWQRARRAAASFFFVVHQYIRKIMAVVLGSKFPLRSFSSAAPCVGWQNIAN